MKIKEKKLYNAQRDNCPSPGTAPGSADPPPAPGSSSMTHKPGTVLCPKKEGHYLHSPTVGFNVNHIPSLHSLFLQTFENTGVQLKKTRVTQRTAMHI